MRKAPFIRIPKIEPLAIRHRGTSLCTRLCRLSIGKRLDFALVRRDRFITGNLVLDATDRAELAI